MSHREQYNLPPADAAQFCRSWSAHVDALDRHLSANMWALVAVTLLLVAYPIARMLIPAALHNLVPEVVRAVLHLI